jgi:hypothetical protein
MRAGFLACGFYIVQVLTSYYIGYMVTVLLICFGAYYAIVVGSLRAPSGPPSGKNRTTGGANTVRRYVWRPTVSSPTSTGYVATMAHGSKRCLRWSGIPTVSSRSWSFPTALYKHP